MDRAGAAVDLIVDEIELALVRPALLVAQAAPRRCDRLSRARWQRPAAIAADRQVIALAHVEIEIDRVERHDGGEQRCVAPAFAAADQVADAHLMIADAPGDRRGDAGEFEIELGRADRGLGLLRPRPAPRAACLRRAGRACSAELEIASCAARRCASSCLLREIELRIAWLLAAPAPAASVDLVGARIDDEQQIALLDDLTVGEMDLGQIAADLRADLDIVDRRELAR